LDFLGGLLGIFVPSFEQSNPNIGYLGCSLSCMTGRSWTQIAASDPGVANYITTLYGFLGAIDICFSLLVIVVASTSFRRGERWAWYALWAFVLRQVFEVIYSGTPLLPLGPTGILIALLGLFLPYRKFFSKGKITSA